MQATVTNVEDEMITVVFDSLEYSFDKPGNYRCHRVPLPQPSEPHAAAPPSEAEGAVNKAEEAEKAKGVWRKLRSLENAEKPTEERSLADVEKSVENYIQKMQRLKKKKRRKKKKKTKKEKR